MRSCANLSARGLHTSANIAVSRKSFPNCVFTSSTSFRGNMAAVMTPTTWPWLVRTSTCEAGGVVPFDFNGQARPLQIGDLGNDEVHFAIAARSPISDGAGNRVGLNEGLRRRAKQSRR
jgi:hypothetical protein